MSRSDHNPPESETSTSSLEATDNRLQLKRLGSAGIDQQSDTKRSKMATSLLDQQASFEELVTCPICMERMETAKHLQCQHAFCLGCLEDWVRQPETPKDRICCPVCRNNTPIPSRVSDLPTDINVSRILDLLRDMKIEKPEKDLPQNTCSSDENVAVYYCQTCRKDLCTKCFQKHNEESSFAQHNVEVLKRKCKTHPDMCLNFFCKQCKSFACMVCKEHGHRRHLVRPLRDVAKFNKEHIAKLVRNLEKCLQQNRLYSNQVGCDTVQTVFSDVAEAIEQHAEHGIHLINRWKNNMLQEVNRKKALALEQACEYENQYALSESLTLYAESKLQEPDYEIVSEYLSLKQSLQQTLEELQNTLQKSHIDVVRGAHFSPNPWPSNFGSLGANVEGVGHSISTPELASARSEDSNQGLKQSNSPSSPFEIISDDFGKVDSEDVYPSTSGQGACASGGSSRQSLYPKIDSWEEKSAVDSPASKSEFDSAISDIGNRQGMSSIDATAPPIEDSHLFNSRSSEYSFDISRNSWVQSEISFSKKIFAEENFAASIAHAAIGFFSWVSGKKKEAQQCPIDIAVDNNKGYLYLLNKSTKDVTRFDFPSDLHMHLPQVVMNNTAATSIAVSPKDDTIAASAIVKIRFQPRGYIPDMSERERADIPTHTFCPYTVRSTQAIAISKNDHWIVLDKVKCLVGIYVHEETLNSGFVFRHLLTFGSEGELPGQFRGPTNICCDSQRDRIYVCDTGNHRIQAFSLKGVFLWRSGKRGHQKGEFEQPQGLCVDGAGNVLVADMGNSRLAVLSGQNGQCQMLIDTNLKVLNYLSPCSVGIYSPEHNNTAYIVIAGMRGQGRMPLVSIMKYTKK